MNICIPKSVRFLTQEQGWQWRDGDRKRQRKRQIWRLEHNSQFQRELDLELELELEFELELDWAPHRMATPMSAEAIEPTKIAILTAA